MYPILFHLGPITIYSYGALVASGVLLSVWLASHQAPREGLSPLKVWNFGIYGILVSLVASKLWLILSSWDYYAANPRAIFDAATLQSGGTFYGGLIGGIAFALYYTRRENLPLLPTLDVSAAPVALGHAIGRLGCFAAGCCFGKPTTVPWAVTFTSEAAARISGTPLHVALHPTQLYEAAAEFINFLVLYLLGRRAHLPGQIVGMYLSLYGVERGLIEFVRDDPGRTLLFHNTVSLMQLVSVALVIGGSWLWLRSPRSSPPAHA